MKFPVTSLESVALLGLGTMRVYGNKEEQTKQRQKRENWENYTLTTLT